MNLPEEQIQKMLRQGPPSAQKKAIHSLFERIEVNGQGEITKVIPREWCRPLFTTLHSVIWDMDGNRGLPIYMVDEGPQSLCH